MKLALLATGLQVPIQIAAAIFLSHVGVVLSVGLRRVSKFRYNYAQIGS
jgi:hypothetical protein